MNLFNLLQERAKNNNPIRVGLIGAGKFGTMFLSQALRQKGIHVVAVADLNPANAMDNMKYVGWTKEQYDAQDLSDAYKSGKTFVGDDWQKLVKFPPIEIIIECTGHPIHAVEHIYSAFNHKKHVINVTVEADAYLGYEIAQQAKKHGVIYSLAYGDQPGLVCELVDWARACGFPIVAAGRGHKWLPHFRQSTPDTIWDNWGINAEQAKIGRLNPKMFNSFLDGSKPAIESSAIANACGLDAPDDGLAFPPGSIGDIANLMRPQSEGGILPKKGMVEVISSLKLDGTLLQYDIRMGVWVVIEGDTQYLRNCFQEYRVETDSTGRYMTNYKRWHLIGLELPISVASVGIRGEATGIASEFRADVPAMAKKDLKKGEILDGEGGYTISGALRPSAVSLKNGYAPLGLLHNVPLLRDVKKDSLITWDDVKLDETTTAFIARKKMESRFK